MKKTYLTFALFLSVLFVGFNAHAASTLFESAGWTQEQNAFAIYICKIRNCFLTNRLILTVATIALSILAIMIMFGKVNWTMALVTITGIAVVTGAYSIVESSGVIPSFVPNFGFDIDGAPAGGKYEFSTKDPCSLTMCFNIPEITTNIKIQ